MKQLKQKYYGTIEIENREKDVVEIWQMGKEESNVVMIERKNLQWVIDNLIAIQKGKF